MLKGELNGLARRLKEKTIDEPEYQVPLFSECDRYERYTAFKRAFRSKSGEQILLERRANRKHKTLEKSGKSVAKCLCAKGNSLQSQMQIIQDSQGMRRLTPVECERLMTWDDDWLKYAIKDEKVYEQSDKERCKQAGNGVVAVVVMKIMESVFK